MKLNTIHQLPLQGKKVFLRLDLNLPLKEGVVQDESRLTAALPTLRFLMEQGAVVAIASHLGRPDGKIIEKYRLKPVGLRLQELLGQPLSMVSDCKGPEVQAWLASAKPGELLLLENTRFYAEEEANDPHFSQELAQGFDLYVNDAFGAIHRGHASTLGITAYLPSYAGFLLEKEVSMLTALMESAQRPLCLVIGGAKIDTKIGILDSFLEKADSFIIGGALANTFLAAQGKQIGSSLYQADKLAVALEFLEKTSRLGKRVLLPVDAAVGTELIPDAARHEISLEAMQAESKIFDIGSKTLELFKEEITASASVLWNGPMGLYEFPAYSSGTIDLAKHLAQADCKSVIGGGDTIDALKSAGLQEEDFTLVSTGGGAMLEFLEGKELPGLSPLKA